MSLKHVSKLIVSGGLILNSIGIAANADGNVLTEKRREPLDFTRSKEQAFPAYKGKSGSIKTALLKEQSVEPQKYNEPWVCWTNTCPIPKDLVKCINDAVWCHNAGNLEEMKEARAKAEKLTEEYNLQNNIFLPWSSTDDYQVLFDLETQEDLDCSFNGYISNGIVPESLTSLINDEAYYSGQILFARDSLRENKITNEKKEFTKRRLVVCFKERNMVRLEIAKYIGKYDIKRVVNNRVVSNESLADNDQSVAVAKPSVSTNTFEKESNNSKSGIYNLICTIKIGVLKLFGLEQESQTFESKERNVEFSIEKQNVENGLIGLVKNFIKHIFALDRQKNSNDTTNSNTNLALVSCADESRLLTQN